MSTSARYNQLISTVTKGLAAMRKGVVDESETCKIGSYIHMLPRKWSRILGVVFIPKSPSSREYFIESAGTYSPRGPYWLVKMPTF
jgi:hypothetical protein